MFTSVFVKGVAVLKCQKYNLFVSSVLCYKCFLILNKTQPLSINLHHLPWFIIILQEALGLYVFYLSVIANIL